MSLASTVRTPARAGSVGTLLRSAVELALKLPWRGYSTEAAKRFWRRPRDWQHDFLATWHHPHRLMLVEHLARLQWRSILEVGSGPGANLRLIRSQFRDVTIGGVDINAEAIELARSTMPDGHWDEASGDQIPVASGGYDVVMSDMCLIYVGPFRIERYLREMQRVARSYVVLVEFHQRSWMKRAVMRLSGRHAYDYDALLSRLGFHNIEIHEMPAAVWPGARDRGFRHLIVAQPGRPSQSA